ncbi:MAG: C40 family peptidase [Actinomycetia bacterium]|nr:C40 family peptidase [Actinomycetes bacterium]
MKNPKRTLALASATAITGTMIGVGVGVTPATTVSAEAKASVVKVKGSKQDRNQKRKQVVRIAKSKVGNQYVRAATGPRTFDCSGLVVYTYKKATNKTVARTASAQNYTSKNVRSKKSLKRGDLIFFNGNGHVGIYIGKNRFVHASNPRTDVRTDSLSGYWGGRINGMGRVIVK